MKPTSPPKSGSPQPVEPPRRRSWFLGLAVALEAAWIVLLAAMNLAR
jgi:hypothetical protein